MISKLLQRVSIISLIVICTLPSWAVPMPDGWKQAANCRKDEGNFTTT